MAQVNILNLPVRIALTGNEYVPGQAVDGTTQRFTTSQIAALGASDFADAVIVTTVAAMKLINPNNTSVCFLDDGGRSGTFFFIVDDFSDQVTTDPTNGIYVAPSLDPTGASGAWVRNFSGGASVLWFGALPYLDGDSSAGDSSAAFAAALATGEVVTVPAALGAITVYDVGDVLLPSGAAITSAVAPSYSTLTSNVVLRRKSGATAVLDLSGATGVLIDGLCIDGVNRVAHGIFCSSAVAAAVDIKNCSIRFCDIGIGGSAHYLSAARIVDCNILLNNVGIENIVDCEVVGNQISAGISHGIQLSAGANDNYIVANRIEHNAGDGIIMVSAVGNVITGNSFDRNHGAAVYVSAFAGACTQVLITGNLLARSGRNNTSGQNCHIALDGTSNGIVITGNTTAYGGDDGTGSNPSPAYIITFVSGAPTDIASAGNDFTGFGTAVVSGSTSGTWQHVADAGLTTDVLAGSLTANSFIPSSSVVPTNGLYLPAANTLGLAINSAAELQLTSTALSPAVDGGNSLGTTALGWQNLFGNTGFVLNIEAGDWVATHTTGILTVGTGDLRVTTAGTNSASVVTVGGTQTLTNKTLTAPNIGAATGTSLVTTNQIWSGSISTALSSLTGATDGFRSSAANVTGVASENTTASSASAGAVVGMYCNDGAAMASGDRLGGIRMGGSSSASALRNSAGLFAFADQVWVDASAYGSRLEWQTTTNGAVVLSTKAILSNAGLFALGATLANTVPGIKASSTTLAVRLADDSADAALTAAGITASGSIVPASSDGAALGSTSKQFSDLFLAAGGVINWNNGTLTATESSGALLISGSSPPNIVLSVTGNTTDAQIRVTSNTITTFVEAIGGDRSIVGSTSGIIVLATASTQRVFLTTAVMAPNTSDGVALGSTGNMWSDLFLASGGVINWNNGDLTLTHSAGLLTNSAAFTTTDLTVTNTPRINVAPSAIGTGTKTISNAADGSTNFGHYAAINLNGTVYYFPCSAVAPT